MPGSPKTDSTGKGLSVFIYAKRYIMRKRKKGELPWPERLFLLVPPFKKN
nr:MAG TPA: hypothetical protein [Caudoviricetes sp.]